MKVCITGISGQLGWNLAGDFKNLQHSVFGTHHSTPIPSGMFFTMLIDLLDETRHGLFQIGLRLQQHFRLPGVVVPSIHPPGNYSRARPRKCNLLSETIDLLSFEDLIKILPVPS